MDNLSASDDRMDKSLNNIGNGILLKFLNANPGVKLFVEDMRGQLKRITESDGLLLIGENHTLQAQFGRDRLGIIFYPERFKLIPESLDLYRSITHKRALAAVRVEGVDDYYGEYLARRPKPPPKPGPPVTQKKPK